MIKDESSPPRGPQDKRRPWFEEIARLKQLEREKQGLVQTVGDSASRVYAFVVAWKRLHDGNSPSMDDVVEGCALLGRYAVMRGLRRLEREGKIKRDGRYKNIEVVGGSWTIPGIDNIIKNER